MIQRSEQHSVGQETNKPMTLDYARRAGEIEAGRPARWAVVLAYVALIIQVPWAFVAMWSFISILGGTRPASALGRSFCENNLRFALVRSIGIRRLLRNGRRKAAAKHNGHCCAGP